jgi:hypothetical protein
MKFTVQPLRCYWEVYFPLDSHPLHVLSAGEFTPHCLTFVIFHSRQETYPYFTFLKYISAKCTLHFNTTLKSTLRNTIWPEISYIRKIVLDAKQTKNRGSSVSIEARVLAGRSEFNSLLEQWWDFFSSPTRPHRLCDPPRLLSDWYRGLLPRVKVAGT